MYKKIPTTVKITKNALLSRVLVAMAAPTLEELRIGSPSANLKPFNAVKTAVRTESRPS